MLPYKGLSTKGHFLEHAHTPGPPILCMLIQKFPFWQNSLANESFATFLWFWWTGHMLSQMNNNLFLVGFTHLLWTASIFPAESWRCLSTFTASTSTPRCTCGKTSGLDNKKYINCVELSSMYQIFNVGKCTWIINKFVDIYGIYTTGATYIRRVLSSFSFISLFDFWNVLVNSSLFNSLNRINEDNVIKWHFLNWINLLVMCPLPGLPGTPDLINGPLIKPWAFGPGAPV